MVILQCILLFKRKGMYLPRHFSGNCYIYELSTQYCSTSEISLRACGNTIKDHKDDVHRLRQLLGKNGASVLYTQTLPSFTIIPFCCRDMLLYILDILFRQITTFIKFHMVFVFGLQIL